MSLIIIGVYFYDNDMSKERARYGEVRWEWGWGEKLHLGTNIVL